MDYKKLKITNVVLGAICLIIEIYVLIDSNPPPIDGIFLFIFFIAVGEAISSLILTMRSQRPRGYRADSFIRGIGMVAMAGSGGLLIYSAIYFATRPPWEARLTAGIIGMIDAIIHCSARNPLLPHNITAATVFSRPMMLVTYPVGQQGNNGEHNLPSYDAVLQQNTEFVTPGPHPQQIYQIPRYPTQQVGIQNYNFVQHPEPPPTYVH